jgi:hypothetical protein
MDRKMQIAIVAVIAIVIVASASAAVLMNGNGNKGSGQKSAQATVWLDDGSQQTSAVGTGVTVREAIGSAIGSEHKLVFLGSGNIASVDGRSATDDRAWTIFQWSSYPYGWKVVAGSAAVINGMNVAVSYSQRTISTDGSVSYSQPSLAAPTYTVYFFIQMKVNINATDQLKSLPLDDASKLGGVWIKGTGTTSCEALVNAVHTYFFPDDKMTVTTSDSSITYSVNDGGKDMVIYSYGTKSDMYGWFLSFLGWTDTKQSSGGGEYGTWTYWSQYCYSLSSNDLSNSKYWGYNNYSFGMYDITQYHYFALILDTTSAEPTTMDINIPAPSQIPSDL